MNLSPIFCAIELEARYGKYEHNGGMTRHTFMYEIGYSIKAAYWFQRSVRI